MAADYRGTSMFGKSTNRRRRWTVCGLVIAGMAGFGLGAAQFGADKLASAREPDARVLQLLASGKTVTGEVIQYPAGTPAKVTALVLTLQPGEETGWHTHDVPAFGYVLEGELSVEYADNTVLTYKPGDALLEAMSIGHNGRNTGSGPMRILAVFMGADGMTLSDPIKR